MTVQFNIDSRHNEDARFKKVLFGYDGELLEVELNELQDIIYSKLSEVVDNVFGTRPLFVGTYTLSTNVLTVANEVVIGNRELILISSSAITVANGDTIYLNIQDKTFTKSDTIKKYGDQGSNTTVTNYMQDSRISDETTRRVQTTYQLVKNTSNPGVNIQLCTINGSNVVKQATSSFADSSLYKEIRRLANEQITASGVQANQNAFSNVKVGASTIASSTTTDTVELAAGTAVTLTPDTTNKKVTIAVNNATASADGSMPKADKSKLDAINQTLATTSSPSFVAMTSTVATGTAPLTVASTTKVTNLNADKVDGFDFDQSVKTTDNVTYKNVTATGTMSVTGNTTLNGALSIPNAPNSLSGVPSTFNTVSQNVETTIPYNGGTGWSNGIFTAPATGTYVFVPTVYLNVTGASTWINCYKNGVSSYQVDKYGNPGSVLDYVLHGIVLWQLNAGDTIKFTLTNQSASCNVNYGHTLCSVFRVS